MKKYILVSTDKFCQFILAILGVEGEYDGFINDGKLKNLCYIIKKDFDRIDFRKFAEIRDLGIEGEIGKDKDELSVRKNKVNTVEARGRKDSQSKSKEKAKMNMFIVEDNTDILTRNMILKKLYNKRNSFKYFHRAMLTFMYIIF